MWMESERERGSRRSKISLSWPLMSSSILERIRLYEEDIEQFENECADLMTEETKRVRAKEKQLKRPDFFFGLF